MPNIGYSTLSVIPSARGFGAALTSSIAPEMAAAGKTSGLTFAKGMAAGIASVALVGVGVVTGLAAIGKTFHDMSSTIRVETGKSGAALDGLVASAKNVGKTTPASFDVIGKTVAGLNVRLGLTGPALELLSRQFIAAGRITKQSLDMNTVTGSFNAFNIKGAGPTSKALDNLFQISQATGMSINDLAAATSKGAPAFRQFGLSFSDSAALVGVLDKAGINSGKTIAALTIGLTKFAKEGKAPAPALRETIDQIQKFTKSGQDAKAIALAATIFGTRGASQFVAAVKSGKVNLDDMMKSAGAGNDTILKSAAAVSTMSSKWGVFKNNVLIALEPIATRVYKALGDGMQFMNDVGLPAVTKFGGALSEKVAPVLKTIGDFIMGTALPAIKNFVAEFANGTGAGGKLRDVLTGVGVALLAVGGFVKENLGFFAPFAVAVLAIVAAIRIWAAVQAALDAVLAMNPIGLIVVAIAALIAGVIYAYTHFQTFHDIVNNVWNGIKLVAGVVIDWFTTTAMPALTTAWSAAWGFLQAAWNTVGKPIFDVIILLVQAWWTGVKIVWDALTTAWGVIWSGVTAVWNTIGSPLFAVLGVVVGLWWAAIKLIWDALTAYWGLLWSGVTAVWNTIGKPLFNLLGTVIGLWWAGVKIVWDALTTAWGVLWGGVVTAWNTVGKPIFDGIGTVVSFLWNNILKPTFVFIVGGFLTLVGAFIQGAADAFGWIPELGPKLREAAARFDDFKNSVNNAIHGVNGQNITVGVKFAINGGSSSVVPGILTNGSVSSGGSSAPGSVGSRTNNRFALGGPIRGGIKGQDSVLGLLMPNEFVVRADGSNLSDAVAHFGGLKRYANGGLVVNTSIPSAQSINDAVNSGFGAFVNGTDFSSMAQSAISAATSAAGGAGGAAQWASLATMALTMLGQPMSSLAGLLRRINLESGGNPRAINLTDSNAMKGTPSMGLMQTIIGTFMAWAGPFAGRGPYDPFASIYAGSNYAIHEYGSVAAVDPLVHPGGYALGTNNAAPGYAWVGEKGKEIVHFGGGEGVTPNSALGGGSQPLIVQVVIDKKVIGTVVADLKQADLRRNGASALA